MVYLFFDKIVNAKPQEGFYLTLFVDVLSGIVFTHLMRLFVLKAGLLKFSPIKQIYYMFLTTLVFSLLHASVLVLFKGSLNLKSDNVKPYGMILQISLTVFGSFVFLLIWNLIYFAVHYFRANFKITSNTSRVL
jgi:hypothetical protein